MQLIYEMKEKEPDNKKKEDPIILNVFIIYIKILGN
jgi:hypothetical protein